MATAKYDKAQQQAKETESAWKITLEPQGKGVAGQTRRRLMAQTDSSFSCRTTATSLQRSIWPTAACLLQANLAAKQRQL
jgi:hypothetical protein